MDLDTFDGIRQKLNLSSMSKPALIGVAAVLAVVAVLITGRLTGAATTTDFEISRGGSSTATSVSQAGADVQSSSASNPASGASASGAATEASGSSSGVGSCRIFVHVAGAVNTPGLCELEGAARVADAVQAAGGFSEDAATESVNLARPLVDGEQIVVANKQDAQAQGEGGVPANAHSAEGGSQGGAASSTHTMGGNATGATPLVNINTASAEELTSLPGVGEATATKIIADRQANGPFKSPEDLKRVAGIGDKKFESLRDLICI